MAQLNLYRVEWRNYSTKISKLFEGGDVYKRQPYEMGNRNACTYCPYQGTCGFDRKIPGYEFRRLKQFADEEIWKAFAKEVED